MCIADGESMIDFLAHHPSTASYVAWKLARRLKRTRLKQTGTKQRADAA